MQLIVESIVNNNLKSNQMKINKWWFQFIKRLETYRKALKEDYLKFAGYKASGTITYYRALRWSDGG